MRRLFLLAGLCGALVANGCAVKDTLWDVFGGAYTAGGPSAEERRLHYDRQFEAGGSSDLHYDPTGGG